MDAVQSLQDLPVPLVLGLVRRGSHAGCLQGEARGGVVVLGHDDYFGPWRGDR